MDNLTIPTGLSIIIPVYNSEGTLGELIRRLAVVLPALAPNYQVVLVNDGSRDKSWTEIQKLCSAHDWIQGINLMRNYGQHNALLCGIRVATYDVIVTMDDDLQHPPEEIQVLLETLDKGYDVVYGTPGSVQHNLWRSLASWLTKLALKNAMGAETARDISAFRVFRTQLRDAFTHYQNPYVSIDVLLTWGTNQFGSVTVQHHPRQIGETNYTFRKLVAHALNMITGFSVLPLRFASLLGFTFALFGVFVLIYVIGRYLVQGGSVPGFPFLASTIAIFSGVQLFALGIIGEYLARMHFRLMDRPSYVVRDSLDGTGNDPG
jgi:undecaprenyl-phosphate 4-deoxy-4-formamido-L-arabinose transferase